jgi:hypothetical protein
VQSFALATDATQRETFHQCNCVREAGRYRLFIFIIMQFSQTRNALYIKAGRFVGIPILFSFFCLIFIEALAGIAQALHGNCISTIIALEYRSVSREVHQFSVFDRDCTESVQRCYQLHSTTTKPPSSSSTWEHSQRTPSSPNVKRQFMTVRRFVVYLPLPSLFCFTVTHFLRMIILTFRY